MYGKNLIGAALSMTLIAAGAAATLALQNTKGAQDKSERRATGGGDDVLLTKWSEFATPGVAHKMLDPRVGKWTLEVRQFEGPNAGTHESTGTSEMKWVMDGRFVQEDATGTFMDMPFKGCGLIGYDNLKKKYVTSWVDNMSTGIMTGESTYDASSKSFNGVSECPDVMAGSYVRSRSVEKWTDNDHFTTQAFGAGPDGKEFMKMEIAYTRQK